MTGTAYLLAGLPGAGKSTLADIGSKITGGGVITAGDLIRDRAAEDGLTDPTSEELGEYAARLREESGAGFFGQMATGMLMRDEIDIERPVWIDSVRHVNGAREFREYFTDTYLIWIESPGARERLQRIRDRGRDDEADFTMADLLQRDSRELTELGVQTIFSDARIDYYVENDKHTDALHDAIREIT